MLRPSADTTTKSALERIRRQLPILIALAACLTLSRAIALPALLTLAAAHRAITISIALRPVLLATRILLTLMLAALITTLTLILILLLLGHGVSFGRLGPYGGYPFTTRRTNELHDCF